MLAYEALIRRLKPHFRNHPKIQSEYQKYKAGFYGETQMDYKLSLLSESEFSHLPDVRLKNNQKFFQMDSVIITPKVIFIIEAKNLQGILEYYASQRQLVQLSDKGQTSYADPLLQAKIQLNHLTEWIRNFNYSIPIEPLVVSTNPSTVIKNIDNNKEFNNRFLTLENLTFRIKEIYHSYGKKILNNYDMAILAKKMIKGDIPLRRDLIKFHGIPQDHFIYGIACAYCEKSPLHRDQKNWICTECGKNDRKIHERVILDYFLLYDTTLSNAQCRKILNLPNRFVAYRMLKTMKLDHYGNKKTTMYKSPILDEFPQDATPEKQ